ncbi:MAG: hypothetical protein ACLP1D_26960 [Xanthobacteraceae bacterium]
MDILQRYTVAFGAPKNLGDAVDDDHIRQFNASLADLGVPRRGGVRKLWRAFRLILVASHFSNTLD